MRAWKCGGVVAGLLLALSHPASADTLRLAATFNGFDVCAIDNNIGCAFGLPLLDLDPTIGILQLADITLGGVLVEGSLHEQTIGGPLNLLESSSLTIQNTTGALVSILASIGGTNFIGPSATTGITGSGTWTTANGSTITLGWYNDPANGQGGESALDRPGVLLATYTSTAVGPLDSFSFSNSIPFPDPGLHSMTLGVNLSLAAGGSLISRGQAEATFPAANPIPEPASLVLLGTGLLGMFVARRRKH